MKKLYIVGVLIDEMVLPALDYEEESGEPILPTVSLAYRDGMRGVLPVYTNKSKANKHAKEIGAKVYPISSWVQLIEGEE
jgi:hypothetical protein